MVIMCRKCGSEIEEGISIDRNVCDKIRHNDKSKYVVNLFACSKCNYVEEIHDNKCDVCLAIKNSDIDVYSSYLKGEPVEFVVNSDCGKSFPCSHSVQLSLEHCRDILELKLNGKEIAQLYKNAKYDVPEHFNLWK